MIVTHAAALALEQEFGGSYVGDRLEFEDVSCYGDAGPRLLVLTPRCEYCGSVNPHVQCVKCGAPASGVQYPAWR